MPDIVEDAILVTGKKFKNAALTEVKAQNGGLGLTDQMKTNYGHLFRQFDARRYGVASQYIISTADVILQDGLKLKFHSGGINLFQSVAYRNSQGNVVFTQWFGMNWTFGAAAYNRMYGKYAPGSVPFIKGPISLPK